MIIDDEMLRWARLLKAQPRKTKLQEGVPGPGHCKGSKHPGAKLTETDVVAIRQLYFTEAPGVFTQKELAKIFKVSRRTVYNILHHKAWKHID